MKSKLYLMLASVWTALSFGQATKANSVPVTMASDQPAIKTREVGEFEHVAASQTNNALGATGAVGDYIKRLIMVPASLNPGAVTMKDGTSGTSRTLFAGGTASINELRPIVVDIDAVSLAAGGWLVTTGADVSVLAVGDFT